MKKTVFVLTVLLFLAGCAETGEQKSTGKMGPQGYIALPVELHVRSDEGLPVEVRLKGEERVPVELQVQDDKAIPVQVQVRGKEGIPVKVQWPEGEGKPVRVELQGDKAVPVKVEMRSDRALPVEMKITQKTLILLMIPVGVSLLAAIGACAAAVAAWRSARNTRVAAEGSFFFTQWNKYASNEMLKAVKLLWDWSGIHRRELVSDKYRNTYQTLEKKADSWANEMFPEDKNKKSGSGSDQEDKDETFDVNKINEARRLVKFYYLSALKLKESGCSGKRFFREICEYTDPLILRIILPLDKAFCERLGKEDSRKKFEAKVKKFKRYMKE